MFKLLMNTALLLLSSLSLFLLPASSALASTSAEKQCYSFIQGNIPWDKRGSNTEWASKNIKTLCKGIPSGKHAQPGLCYSKVQGGVIWDNKNNKKWSWKNVVKLCAGARNAQSRVACFKRKVKSKGWSKAINQCVAKPKTPPKRDRNAEKRCYSFIQGNINWDINNSNARWNPANVKNLCKGSRAGKHAEPGLCYAKTQGVIAWSKSGNKKWAWKNVINLCTGTRSAKTRTSCFKRKVGEKGWSKAINQCRKLK